MDQQMTDHQQQLVRDTLLDATRPLEDVDDCMQHLMEKSVFSSNKIRTFGAQLRQVCEEALAERHARTARSAMNAVPPTPPTSAISPPSSADPVPGTLQDDEALRAAATATSSRDTRGLVHLWKSSTLDFHFAFASLTNAEFSYITERRLRQLGLPCNNKSIRIGWKKSNLSDGGDHTAKETVFVLVSDEQASRVRMDVDILFGRHYDEDVEVQLQAVRPPINFQSAPPPSEIQPDDSCAGSVAGAAMLPAQAAKPPTTQFIAIFGGQGCGQVAADFLKTMAP